MDLNEINQYIKVLRVKADRFDDLQKAYDDLCDGLRALSKDAIPSPRGNISSVRRNYTPKDKTDSIVDAIVDNLKQGGRMTVNSMMSKFPGLEKHQMYSVSNKLRKITGVQTTRDENSKGNSITFFWHYMSSNVKIDPKITKLVEIPKKEKKGFGIVDEETGEEIKQ